MTKIAILGKTGMLGSAVFNEFNLTDDYEVIRTTREELNAEYSSESDIENLLKGSNFVINCIGIIKPYIHDNKPTEIERAIRVNSLFPHKLSKVAEQIDCKVIQIATDCVFDGENGNYTEASLHNPTDVYGKTKSLGEVQSKNFLNLRCSIIGKEEKSYLSLLEWFLKQPKETCINGFKNHYWNGITTKAFAKICKGIINNNNWISGTQHVIPSDIVTKADMLHIFANVFERYDIKINDIDASESINRTLKTNYPQINENLWLNAGYKSIPNIKNLIKELK